MSPKWLPRWAVVRARHPTYWIRHTPTSVEKVIHRSRIQPVPRDTHWPDDVEDDPHLADGSSGLTEATPTFPPPLRAELVPEPVGRSLTTGAIPLPLPLADHTPLAEIRDISPAPDETEPATHEPATDTATQPLRMVISRASASGPTTRSTPYIVKSSTVSGE